MEISRNKHRAQRLFTLFFEIYADQSWIRFLEVAANITDTVGAAPHFNSSNADCAAGTDVASDVELPAGRFSRAADDYLKSCVNLPDASAAWVFNGRTQIHRILLPVKVFASVFVSKAHSSEAEMDIWRSGVGSGYKLNFTNLQCFLRYKWEERREVTRQPRFPLNPLDF